MKRLMMFAAILASLIACTSDIYASEPLVKTGIEVLRDRNFRGLLGKRVGLVTNPSGVDHQLNSTIDILYNAPEVELVALFGPEHGVRGNIYAGDKVSDARDEATGLPVYSIYGATRKPTLLPSRPRKFLSRRTSIPVFTTGAEAYTSDVQAISDANTAANIISFFIDRLTKGLQSYRQKARYLSLYQIS